MKNSIRFKLFAVMSSLVVFFVVFSWILNLLVLERYYNYVKKDTLFKSYESVKHIIIADPEELSLEIEKIENTNGLYVVILDKQFNTLYNSRQKAMNLPRRENRDGLGRNGNEPGNGSDAGNVGGNTGSGGGGRGPDYRNMPESLIQTRLSDIEKGIPIVEVRKDNRLNTNFISLFSKLNDNSYIYMSTPVATIKESVQITNNFFIITGVVTILIGAVLIFLLSSRFTRPILELSGIAERMAHLDFGKKYKIESLDEIGHLGESINSLSEHLQKSIMELKEANDMLKEDNEKKQMIDEMRKEFISSASHELKTPIALISGYAEGLKVNVIRDEENKNYYCDVIIDESNKMNKLVSNLLALSQIESGEVPIENCSFNINQLTETVVKKNSITFDEKNIEVVFENDGDYEVYGDYHKIEQVLNNYINNAINHVTDKNIIKINITNEDKLVKVSVYNSGEQIPEESIDKIWSSFYKVDKARTRAYGGTGLGLSVVRAIMESHGSDYGVKNHRDGVEFWFNIKLN